MNDILLEKFRDVPGNFWETQCAHFLPIMFLEFISNLAVKFRNITCEIQKLPSKKPETILKD